MIGARPSGRRTAFTIALLLPLISLAKPPPAKPDVQLLDGLDALVKTLAEANAGGAPVVVHFWATWCPPCMKELPLVSKLVTKAHAAGARDVVISVDAKKDLSGKVTRALRKVGLNGRSYLLANVEFENVAKLLDPGWDGGLPATFVVRESKPRKAFYGPLGKLDDVLAAIRQPPSP